MQQLNKTWISFNSLAELRNTKLIGIETNTSYVALSKRGNLVAKVVAVLMTLIFILVISLVIAVALSLLINTILKRKSLTEVLLVSFLFILTGGFLLIDQHIGDNGIYLSINYGLIFIGFITGILSFIIKKD
ncbi:hypothetical protein [Paenibacillus sp. N3.4]|uniref:hypothetical protein n=1 Tax=Paenibacillus sp. N3.4 TaxID=2603222 RepID=UPI0011CC78E9|nr:hypothetical protein [Paenibacillus sp. N3.4]TXK83749.1 hypothetical protein FU659_12635 [Paenibacillus sp. N3.4]